MRSSARKVDPAHLNVDRRRSALVEHRIHQAAGLKVSSQLRNLRSDARAHLVHIYEAAFFVVFLQPHLNKRGVHTGVRREQRGKVGRQADIGNDGFQFPGRDDLAHDVFHALHIFFGQLNPRAGRRLHVDDKLTGVSSRKERDSHEGNQEETEAENYQKSHDDQSLDARAHRGPIFRKNSASLRISH